MFLYLKCCFSEKLEQRPVDDMQKYADDTRTTCRRHITSGFCPKIEKKHPGAPKWKKKIRGHYAKQDIFFSLTVHFKYN